MNCSQYIRRWRRSPLTVLKISTILKIYLSRWTVVNISGGEGGYLWQLWRSLLYWIFIYLDELLSIYPEVKEVTSDSSEDLHYTEALPLVLSKFLRYSYTIYIKTSIKKCFIGHFWNTKYSYTLRNKQINLSEQNSDLIFI